MTCMYQNSLFEKLMVIFGWVVSFFERQKKKKNNYTHNKKNRLQKQVFWTVQFIVRKGTNYRKKKKRKKLNKKN